MSLTSYQAAPPRALIMTKAAAESNESGWNRCREPCAPAARSARLAKIGSKRRSISAGRLRPKQYWSGTEYGLAYAACIGEIAGARPAAHRLPRIGTFESRFHLPLA